MNWDRVDFSLHQKLRRVDFLSRSMVRSATLKSKSRRHGYFSEMRNPPTTMTLRLFSAPNPASDPQLNLRAATGFRLFEVQRESSDYRSGWQRRVRRERRSRITADDGSESCLGERRFHVWETAFRTATIAVSVA